MRLLTLTTIVVSFVPFAFPYVVLSRTSGGKLMRRGDSYRPTAMTSAIDTLVQPAMDAYKSVASIKGGLLADMLTVLVVVNDSCAL